MPLLLFFEIFDLIFHGGLMEINSADVHFRSRMMLCFDNEKQKHKNILKDNNQSEYFVY